MKQHIRHTDIEQLLHTLRLRELSADEWHHLDLMSARDPFLRDAIDGLKQLPGETRNRHIQSLLLKLRGEKRKTGKLISTPVWLSVAASVVIIVGVVWLITRNPLNDPQIAQNTTLEEPQTYGSESMDSVSDGDLAVVESAPSSTHPADEALSRPREGALVPPPPDIETLEETATGSEDEASDLPSAPGSPAVTMHSKGESGSARQKTDASQSDNDHSTVLNKAAIPEVRGIVMNSDGEPLSGVQVKDKGTGTQTETNYQGNFALDVPFQSYANALVISSQGYPPVEMKAADGDSLVVRLQEDAPTGNAAAVTKLAQRRSASKESPSSRALAQPLLSERSYTKYIRQNLRYPEEAAIAGIHGTVTLEFDISPEGMPFNFRIVRSLGYGCDDEAIRLIREGPKWNAKDAQVGIGRWDVEF